MFSDDSADLDGPEMSDAQTRAQVVEPAQRLVQSVGLQLRGATFRFSACTDQGVAPFRGLVEMGFTFPPGTVKEAYVDEIVKAMADDGWSDGAPAGKKPYGRAMHQGEVMALVSPNPDHPDRGIVEIYGECRNAADHSGDNEDIRSELTG
ncbi:hypothetical protein [Mycolicibacterium sediminis]|uniref:Lipoprotein LppJ n=1 Tax=Mycolicibacterium sediminis TaxID=1286180 RepID=A0A7I7QLR2_9MYCO|nr:hypothetical protein [Mycolicibacterium sediminis]BBY27241.1 hypothetical protein MSEDJ_13370 [Mycolicibacterium sediminis]